MNEPNQSNPGASVRVVYFRGPKPMTEEQLRLALGGRAEDDPLLRAVHQLIDRRLATASFDASSPQLDPRKGTYPGGQMAALAELKEEMEGYRTQPVKPAAAPAAAKAKTRGRR